MNFNRHSPCKDVLFAMVLLLPSVCAAAGYIESDARSYGSATALTASQAQHCIQKRSRDGAHEQILSTFCGRT